MPLDSEAPTPHPLPLRYRCVSKIPRFDPPRKLLLSAPAQGDRLDITGDRWSLAGAEAVLKLLALIASHPDEDLNPR